MNIRQKKKLFSMKLQIKVRHEIPHFSNNVTERNIRKPKHSEKQFLNNFIN